MLKSLLWWALAGGLVPLMGIPLAILSIPDPQRRLISRGAYLWSWILMKTAGCTLKVEGAEKFKRYKQFVVVCNHQSYFDIFTLVCVLRRAPHFLAKKELFQIPIFGQLLSLAQVIKIDRQDPDAAIESIKRGLTKGISRPIAIFPEGTRSPDGHFQPFRKKGLNILIETGLPLFPMAIKGTRRVMPKGSYTVKSATIQVKVGEPVFTKPGLSEEEKALIRERIWRSIDELLKA